MRQFVSHNHNFSICENIVEILFYCNFPRFASPHSKKLYFAARIMIDEQKSREIKPLCACNEMVTILEPTKGYTVYTFPKGKG